MKAFLQKNGRTIGGLYGIAAGIAFFLDMNTLGGSLAACALVLVALSQCAKNAKE